MNRLRACLFALLASGLVATAARAATIEVTTTADTVAADNLCSLREAVDASRRATKLAARKSALSQTKTGITALDTALLTLRLNENDTFQSSRLLPMLQAVESDLLKHEPATPAQQAVIDTLLNTDPNPNPPPPMAPYPPTYDPLKDPYPEYAVDNGVTPMITYLNGAIADGRDAGLPIVERVRELMIEGSDAMQVEIDRLEAANKIDGCDDGTAFDTIILEDKTYTLDSELPIDVRLTLHGAGDTKTAIEASAAGYRLLVIDETVDIASLELRNASAGGVDGGAMLVKGAANISRMTFRNNYADNGGAIWVTSSGYLSVSDARFYGNHAANNGGAIGGAGGTMKLSQVTLGKDVAGQGNAADKDVSNVSDGVGDGGGVYYAPVVGGGSFSIDRSSVVNNTAQAGSGLRLVSALDGAAATIENVTIAKNTAPAGAALDIAFSGVGDLLSVNNITLVQNDGGSATGGIRLSSAIDYLTIDNSLIAGNQSAGASAVWDQDCDFSAVKAPPYNPLVVADADFLALFNRNYYGNIAGAVSLCPGSRWSLATPTATNYERPGADTTVDPVSGPGYLLQPLDPETGVYVPVFPDDVLANTENRLVNRGASTQEAFRCADTDQRDNARASFVDTDCDIGAVEYQIGRRQDDYVTAKANLSTCVDVALNDRGDAQYIPYTLEVLDIERPGARATIASTNPAGYVAAWLLRYPLPTDPPPPTVVDRSTCPNVADFTAATSAEVILYTPAPGFIGETNVTYGLGWRTADPLLVPTAVTGTVSGLAHLTSEARGGFRSETLGAAVAPWSLLGTLLLALRRRRRAVAAGVLAVAGVLGILLPAHVFSANENVIYVNSGADELTPVAGDGACTLREALTTARNDQANLTKGDCLDGNEGPDVIEFTTAVSDVLLKGPVDSWGGVTIRCPAKPDPTVAVPSPVQQVCTIKPDPSVTPNFSLINSHGSIGILRMRLEGGRAGASNDGGAIFSIGAVSISQSTFRDNRARTGGAVFLAGTRGDLSVVDSLFVGNQSTGTTPDRGGGALAVSAYDQHGVFISGSTFTQNHAENAGGAVLVSGTIPSVIVDSTFSGNDSAFGAGAIDMSTVSSSVTLRNLTVVDNRSYVITPAVPGPGNLFGAINAGNMAVGVTNSIIASNYDNGGNGYDANCSGANIQFTSNLFGETVSGATCTVGTANSWQQDTTVYNVADPVNAGYLWPLVDPNATSAPYPLFNFNDTNQIPPRAPTAYHVFHDATAVQGIIIDAGYDNPATPGDPDLVSPFTTGTVGCASVDQRGVTRGSGGRCDIGAVEWIKTTAIADSGGNNGRGDRLSVVDVLGNDIYEETNKCVPTQVDNATPGVAKILNASGNPCAWVDYPPAYSAEFVKVLDDPSTTDPRFKVLANLANNTPVPGQLVTESPYVLVFDSHNEMTENMLPISFTYHIYGNEVPVPVASADASIEVTVDNVAPVAKNDTVSAPVGKPVTIDVLANDSDPDMGLDPPSDDTGAVIPTLTASGLDPSSVRITGSNCTPVRLDTNNDGSLENEPIAYWQCQFGRATVNPATGAITWTPGNAFNPFTESFSYEVKDYSYIVKPGASNLDIPRSKVASATVTIHMDRPQANAGAIFGQNDLSDMLGINWLGATGNLFFLSLGVSVFRRRRNR